MAATAWILATLVTAAPGPVQDTAALVAPVAMVALVDVDIADVDAGRIVPHQTVVVAEGRVLARGAAGSTPVPRGARTIDGTGLTLVPGLVDAHAHTDSLGLGLLLANGVTAVREMNGAERHLRWRDRIAAGDLPGPRMLVTTELLAGERFDGVRYRLVEDPEDARTAAREAVAAGYDYFKIYDGLSAGAYEVLVDEAQRAAIPLTGHIPRDVGLEGVLAAGQGLEHAEKVVFDVLGHALEDAGQLERAMDRIAAAGVPVTATLAVHEVLTGTGDTRVRLQEADELAYVGPGTLEWWAAVAAPAGPGAAREGAETWGTRFMRAQRRLIAGLVDRGVPVLAGTDTPNPLMVPGFSLLEELEALVRAGLSRREALATATMVPGEVLPFPVPTGRIEPGYAADLVAVEGDPFLDLAVLRHPAGVMAGGRWYGRAELDAMLEGIRRAWR